jgi:RNA polymerase sigma factor (sigma-70 family)
VECYQVHYPRLVRALTLAGAAPPVAEDLAQEAFARMLTHWRRVRRGSSPAGYAYRTGFRLLHRSRRGRRGLDLAAQFPSHFHPGEGIRDGNFNAAATAVPGPEGLVTTRLAVQATLAAMPPRRRACAVMCLVVGLSTADVAAALGIAEGTVRKQLSEARDDLRAVLGL